MGHGSETLLPADSSALLFRIPQMFVHPMLRISMAELENHRLSRSKQEGSSL